MNPVLLGTMSIFGVLAAAIVAVGYAYFNHREKSNYNRNYHYEGPEICEICLKEMGQNYRRLLCGHKFHKDCIENVFSYEVRRTCPKCQKLD